LNLVAQTESRHKLDLISSPSPSDLLNKFQESKVGSSSSSCSPSFNAATLFSPRREISDWVSKMDQEGTTATTAMTVLVDMYKRKACTKSTLAEYSDTLRQIGIFNEIIIPSFDRGEPASRERSELVN